MEAYAAAAAASEEPIHRSIDRHNSVDNESLPPSRFLGDARSLPKSRFTVPPLLSAMVTLAQTHAALECVGKEGAKAVPS